jgi:hypothetical protein
MGITQFADMSTEEFIGKIHKYFRKNFNERFKFINKC